MAAKYVIQAVMVCSPATFLAPPNSIGGLAHVMNRLAKHRSSADMC